MTRDVGFGLSVIQLSILLAVSSLNLWMVRCFLLSEDEEHYEPTVPFSGDSHCVCLFFKRTIGVGRGSSGTLLRLFHFPSIL